MALLLGVIKGNYLSQLITEISGLIIISAEKSTFIEDEVFDDGAAVGELHLLLRKLFTSSSASLTFEMNESS